MKLTAKQEKVLKVLNNKEMFNLFYGGSRSGKTFAIVLFILTILLTKSNLRALVGRLHYADVRDKIVYETLPTVWSMLTEDNIEVYHNKIGHFYEFQNGSRLIYGGFSDKHQADKILGSEYDIIFLNELRQISFSTFELVLTRLNGKGQLKLICDTNPPVEGKRHWLYEYFFENKIKGEGISNFAKKNIKTLLLNPADNQENLSKHYLETLKSGSKHNYQRYALGQFVSGGESPVYYNFFDKNETERDIVYDRTCEHWVGWDFGVANPTAMVYFQLRKTPGTKSGYIIEILKEHQNNRKVVKHYADFHKKAEGWRDYRHAGDPSARASGVNLVTWAGELLKDDIFLITPKKYEIDNWILIANQYMSGIRINRAQTPLTYDMLVNWNFLDDGKPDVSSDHSHLGTAFYYFFAVRFGLGAASVTVEGA